MKTLSWMYDTPNHVYAYSFEPSFHWNEFYSKRDSVYEYLKFCTNKYNLSKHIEFNTSVKSAVFNEEKGVWETIVEKNGSEYNLESVNNYKCSRPIK